ncbi:MAG: deoxynucleoside kinase [Bacteroidota bacterium]|nr:deoxynucleoside kinase [Bacteroidota bacterium]
MQNKFIVVEGNIGAGKTSLTNMISEQYSAKAVYEAFADNPFLSKFYKEPERYSFQLELSFLAERFQQLKSELSNRDVFKSLIVSDYYFSKSLIFAQSTLSGDEYALYRKIYSIIYSSLPKPDLYVYLYKTSDQLLENIKKRGRDYEQDIKADYLNDIQSGYFDYFKQNQELTFLVIDTNFVDFINNKEHYNKIRSLIFDEEYSHGVHRRSVLSSE